MRDRNQLQLFEKSEKNGEGDWDFTSEDTQYLTHGIHPYLAAMIPQITEKLLNMYGRQGVKVLDPFVGGGAVLVESYLAELPSSGYDINPLAVLVSKAKTTPIPRSILTKASLDFHRTYPDVNADIPKFSKGSRVDFWFKDYMFEPLGKIRAALQEVASQADEEWQSALKTLLDCIYSNTVRDVSLTYRGEVRLRKLRGEDYDKFNPNVLEEFTKRMENALQRVSLLPLKKYKPSVFEGNCRNMHFQDNEFDLVITSPPYGDIKNTIPYHQFSKNMLYWLGIGDESLIKMRGGSLGAKNGQQKIPSSKTLKNAISKMNKPNLIEEAVRFYVDYLEALKEITRVTSERVVITIGHRILNAVHIDNPNITTELMNSIGWRLEDRFNRKIRKKRLNRKMGFGNNAKGGTIDTEAILVYTPSY